MKSYREYSVPLLAVIAGLIVVSVGSIVYAAISTPTAVHIQYPTRGTPTKAVDTLRTAAVLTTGYVATTDSVVMRGYSAVGIFFDITQGSLTEFRYKVWNSHDSINWFQEANETVAATIITDTVHYYKMVLSGDVKYYKVVPVYGTYLKLEVAGVGTVTGSSCAVYIVGVE